MNNVRRNRAAPFRQIDVTRLIKATLAAGVPVEHIAGIQADGEGVKVFFNQEVAEPATSDNSPEEWLNRKLTNNGKT